MSPVGVVPALDEPEDRVAGRLGVGEADSVEQLALEGGEEGLSHGVVVAVPHRTHGGPHPGGPTAAPERQGGVLGEFKGSSQHLESEELQWEQESGDELIVQDAFRCGRPVARSPTGGAAGASEPILGGDCPRVIERGCGSCRRCVTAVGTRWFRENGGMPSSDLVPLSGRSLSFAEREEIAILHTQGFGIREIARRIGRCPSTVSRELRRNAATRGGDLQYRATTAQWHADRRARRPKVAKLAANNKLRQYVQDRLAGAITAADGTSVPGPDVRWVGRRHGRRQERRWASSWSPEQIAHRLRVDFPKDDSLRISHEAIYQALYVQSRGALRRELVACLRTGRALRVPRARTRGRGKKFVNSEIMISERPAEAEDRAVPGHREGDLILGLDSSAIGTLVERTTRFTILLYLPRMDGHGSPPVKNGPALTGHGAKAVRDAIASSITKLPEQLRRTLTWDQGAEMAQHAQLHIDTGLAIFFCDPRSPWQRGTNENTNGLLRQYFPKGTDLSTHSGDDLEAVASALNSRPRTALGWTPPAEALDVYLRLPESSVATTPGTWAIHLPGVRAPLPGRRGAALHGFGGGLLRQRHGRILLRHPGVRAARPDPLPQPEGCGRGDLRVHRGLVQPPPATLRPRLPVARKLRTTTPGVGMNRRFGHSQWSTKSGQAQNGIL